MGSPYARPVNVSGRTGECQVPASALPEVHWELRKDKGFQVVLESPAMTLWPPTMVFCFR